MLDKDDDKQLPLFTEDDDTFITIGAGDFTTGLDVGSADVDLSVYTLGNLDASFYSTASSSSYNYNYNNTMGGISPLSINDIITLGSDTDFSTTKIQGNLNINDGDINIRGVSLSDRLSKIEERLGVLVPNPELEADYEKLQKLGKQYRRLEKKLLEQKQTWEILKRDEDAK